MFVCVVSLSQPSSRDLLYVKCLCVCVVSLSQPSSRDLLYVKCLCVLLSRYLSPVESEICSAHSSVKCLCVLLSRYLSPVVEICYMLNVCVCVVSFISAQ